MRAARLIDMAEASAWIHLAEPYRGNLMKAWRRMAEGKPERRWPLDVDPAKLTPKALKAYTARYGPPDG